jgi:hypothetical protein
MTVKTSFMDSRLNTTNAGPMRITTDSGLSGLHLNRPGFRCLLEDDAGRERAYNDYDNRQLQDCYKGDAVGEGPEGSECTIKNAKYAAYFSGPGRIVGGICTPLELLSSNADARAKEPDDDDDDEGYEQGEDEINENAATHTQTAARPRSRRSRGRDAVAVQRQMQEHEQRMASIYDALDRELENSYRK